MKYPFFLLLFFLRGLVLALIIYLKLFNNKQPKYMPLYCIIKIRPMPFKAQAGSRFGPA